MPLIVTQQAHLLPPPPLAHFLRTQPGSFYKVGPPMSNVPSPNGAVSPHSDLLLEQLVLPSLSLQSVHLHAQHSQSAPRVASTVVVPAGVQPGTKSALLVPALSAKPCSTTLAQPARISLEFAFMQTTIQVGAPTAQDAHYAFQSKAPFACAQPFAQVGAPFATCVSLYCQSKPNQWRSPPTGTKKM